MNDLAEHISDRFSFCFFSTMISVYYSFTMTRIAIFGEKASDVRPLLEKYSDTFTLVDENPEYVFSFGGDGTLMRSESEYPGVPKLFLKNSKISKLSHGLLNEEALDRFVAGKFNIKEHIKIQATISGQTLVGLNE